MNTCSTKFHLFHKICPFFLVGNYTAHFLARMVHYCDSHISLCSGIPRCLSDKLQKIIWPTLSQTIFNQHLSTQRLHNIEKWKYMTINKLFDHVLSSAWSQFNLAGLFLRVSFNHEKNLKIGTTVQDTSRGINAENDYVIFMSVYVIPLSQWSPV